MNSPRSLILLFFILHWCSLGSMNENRYKRQSSVSCDDKNSTFTCVSGICIDKDKVCDGHGDCSGGDDESETACECGTSKMGNFMTRTDPDLLDTSVGEFPWQAGVFKSTPHQHFKLLCSGTLIYPDVVLTSASCLFDLETYSPEKVESMKVGLGILKRDFNTIEEHQQKFNVSRIVPYHRYEGDFKKFNYNVGLILLEGRVEITDFVRPICLWPDRRFPSNRQALITGWGIQYFNNFALNLKKAYISYITASECLKQRSQDPLMRVLFTNDKFCITFSEDKKSVIDTGGGVSVFNNGRYYLIGVISVRHSGEPMFAFTTNTYKYLKWIRNETHQFRAQSLCANTQNPFYCIDSRKCVTYDQVCDTRNDCEDGSDEASCSHRILLYSGDDGRCEIPEGKAKYEETGCTNPRGCLMSRYVSDRTSIDIKCPKNYGFVNSELPKVTTTCHRGQWFPPFNDTCQERCTVDYKSFLLKCEYLGRKANCQRPLRPGTEIEVDCHPQYQRDPSEEFINRTTCLANGTIAHKLTKCIPVCGVPYHGANPLISKGSEAKLGKYPWHVALYWLLADHLWHYHCGGTIITANKILTAAHCVYIKSSNSYVTADKVAIKAGKYHSSWWKEDPLEQTMFVKEIILGENFDGIATDYAQDIAVLLLTENLELDSQTSPVCLDLDLRFGGIPTDRPGYVVGWGKFNESVKVTDTLRETTLTYLDLKSCKHEFRASPFRRFLHADKFCVLYKEGSGPQGGDSGGGLTYDHGGAHYIYGVVSVKQPDVDTIASFTDVSKHSQWLKQILDEK